MLRYLSTPKTLRHVLTRRYGVAEDHHFWTHILMEAVINLDRSSQGFKGLGIMRGGSMHTPDLEGVVRLDDNKKYMAVKNGQACYYNNENVSSNFLFLCFFVLR